jgi:rhamnosyltransferase
MNADLAAPLPRSHANPDTFPGMKVCAVMVTYNPDPSVEQNIRALLPQVDKLIVVDNHSEPPIRVFLTAVAAACNFEMIWNDENLGLAAALNTGIRRALAENYPWIATFDHDSRVSPGFIETMLKAYLSCPFRDQVALIGPYHLLFPEDPAARALLGELTPPFREMPAVLQSGSLFSSEGLRRVGLLDESFFIDYVDFEFCLRLRKHSLRIIEAVNAVLVHRVGNPTAHTVLNKTCVVFNHSPLRHYYVARNRLRLYGRYLSFAPFWICHDAWSWLKELIKLLLFERDRWQKLRSTAKGVWHALRGRTGVYPGRPGH